MLVAQTIVFPGAVFSWVFYLLLVGFLSVLAYTDVRWIWIPKKGTVALLIVGLLLNLARGTWLGLTNETDSVWWLPAGPAWGWLDGLLFGLAGFGLALALFFGLYFFGMAAGGDLKLVAALGAWVGPTNILWILLGTVVVMALLAFADLVRRVIRRGPQKAIFSLKSQPPRGKDGKPLPVGAQRRKSLVAYALPIAITTAVLVLLWNKEQLLGVKAETHTTDSTQAATAPQ
jgi:Flp pilus assembly protein protease CpaA